MTVVVQCEVCKQRGVTTYHDNEDSRCPVCGAGIYWQLWITREFDDSRDLPEYHPAVIEMYHQKACRYVGRALSITDREGVERIKTMIAEWESNQS